MTMSVCRESHIVFSRMMLGYHHHWLTNVWTNPEMLEEAGCPEVDTGIQNIPRKKNMNVQPIWIQK